MTFKLFSDNDVTLLRIISRSLSLYTFLFLAILIHGWDKTDWQYENFDPQTKALVEVLRPRKKGGKVDWEEELARHWKAEEEAVVAELPAPGATANPILNGGGSSPAGNPRQKRRTILTILIQTFEQGEKTRRKRGKNPKHPSLSRHQAVNRKRLMRRTQSLLTRLFLSRSRSMTVSWASKRHNKRPWRSWNNIIVLIEEKQRR